jgi:hydroxypyruvate isomerase
MMFNEVGFMDRFGVAANAGFKGVEYLLPYDFPADDIAEQLEKHNLKQVLFDFPVGDFAAGERGIAIQPDRKGEFQDGVGQAIEYARTLNCKRLTVLAGLAPNDVAATVLQDTLVENIKFASAAAEPLGITVLLEPLNTVDTPGFFIFRTNHALAVISAAGSPANVKLQYDVYHMQIMEGDLLRTIDANQEMIGHFQIADNPGRNEPGTGEINYGNVLRHLDEIGYDGWVGCEYKPAGNTVTGLGWATDYVSP